jgi:hypothetical protein
MSWHLAAEREAGREVGAPGPPSAGSSGSREEGAGRVDHWRRRVAFHRGAEEGGLGRGADRPLARGGRRGADGPLVTRGEMSWEKRRKP